MKETDSEIEIYDKGSIESTRRLSDGKEGTERQETRLTKTVKKALAVNIYRSVLRYMSSSVIPQ